MAKPSRKLASCQALDAAQNLCTLYTAPLMLQVPVAEGSRVTFIGLPKTWVADFVHGSDGFGNMAFPPIQVDLSHKWLHIMSLLSH